VKRNWLESILGKIQRRRKDFQNVEFAKEPATRKVNVGTREKRHHHFNVDIAIKLGILRGFVG